jgi:hypothetical protein
VHRRCDAVFCSYTGSSLQINYISKSAVFRVTLMLSLSSFLLTSQNTATIVYRVVYFIICTGKFSDSQLSEHCCEWRLSVTNGRWSVTRCLPPTAQMQCRFSMFPLCPLSVVRSCLCECKKQEQACSMVPFNGHAHNVTVVSLAVLIPQR